LKYDIADVILAENAVDNQQVRLKILQPAVAIDKIIKINVQFCLQS